MYITPLSPFISPIQEQESIFKQNESKNEEAKVKQPTFLDVFSNIYTEAVQTQQQKSEDMVRLMLGDVDDIEQIQLNLNKAEIATSLFINVKNSIVDTYNEIAKMNI